MLGKGASRAGNLKDLHQGEHIHQVNQAMPCPDGSQPLFQATQLPHKMDGCSSSKGSLIMALSWTCRAHTKLLCKTSTRRTPQRRAHSAQRACTQGAHMHQHTQTCTDTQKQIHARAHATMHTCLRARMRTQSSC